MTLLDFLRAYFFNQVRVYGPLGAWHNVLSWFVAHPQFAYLLPAVRRLVASLVFGS